MLKILVATYSPFLLPAKAAHHLNEVTQAATRHRAKERGNFQKRLAPA